VISVFFVFSVLGTIFFILRILIILGFTPLVSISGCFCITIGERIEDLLFLLGAAQTGFK
jgi:hypothetical protein